MCAYLRGTGRTGRARGGGGGGRFAVHRIPVGVERDRGRRRGDFLPAGAAAAMGTKEEREKIEK